MRRSGAVGRGVDGGCGGGEEGVTTTPQSLSSSSGFRKTSVLSSSSSPFWRAIFNRMSPGFTTSTTTTIDEEFDDDDNKHLPKKSIHCHPHYIQRIGPVRVFGTLVLVWIVANIVWRDDANSYGTNTVRSLLMLHRTTSNAGDGATSSVTIRTKTALRYNHSNTVFLVDPFDGIDDGKRDGPSNDMKYQCPYMSLNDLAPEVRHPKADGTRYIVDPPQDTKISLVCCETTQGPWNILVHYAWSPHGAQRFMEMVHAKYFDYRVPLMRCVDEFVCQFGLAGEYSSMFASKIPDDPNWLPNGKDGRVNKNGVKRFQKGYFAYAGSGPNTRGRQLFVALENTRSLGDADSSPWEVPWGELVGDHSYETLSKIYTGYGENGPSQDLLVKSGVLDEISQDFPELDWIISCSVVDEDGDDEEVNVVFGGDDIEDAVPESKEEEEEEEGSDEDDDEGSASGDAGDVAMES